jgi:hypothetical protein
MLLSLGGRPGGKYRLIPTADETRTNLSASLLPQTKERAHIVKKAQHDFQAIHETSATLHRK